MLGMSMSMKVCLPKRKAHAGEPVSLSGTECCEHGGPKGWDNTRSQNMAYLTHPVYPRSSPRNAPSRSKIEAHKTGRDIAPTAPGRHGKGESCATKLPRYPLNGGRAGSQPADQIRSAGIAGQRNGYGSRRIPAGPEGGKRGVRAMGEGALV